MVLGSFLGTVLSPKVVDLALSSKLEEQREAEQADELAHQQELLKAQALANKQQKAQASAKLVSFGLKTALVAGAVIAILIVSRRSNRAQE